MAYIIEGAEAGKSRLSILARAMNGYSVRALHQAGIQKGFRCLDAGCGGGSMTFVMSELVGTTGFVDAFDFDSAIIQSNISDLRSAETQNIRFFQSDIYQGTLESDYDLIFARYLLSHLPDPQKALALFMDALKPGATILVEDVEFAAHICYPSSEGFHTYVRWYTEAAGQQGGDANMGPKLCGLMSDAGFRNIGVRIAQPIGLSGPAKQMSLLTLDKIKESLLSNQICAEHEFDQVRAELALVSEDDMTIMSIPRTFQVWGYKPI